MLTAAGVIINSKANNQSEGSTDVTSNQSRRRTKWAVWPSDTAVDILHKAALVPESPLPADLIVSSDGQSRDGRQDSGDLGGNNLLYFCLITFCMQIIFFPVGRPIPSNLLFICRLLV